VSAVFFLCLLATCFGPYSFHLYEVIFKYSQAKLAYSMIRELQPLNFRFVVHYFQLLLTAAAFFALGWQKKIDPFKLALLVIASLVSFRTMRDSWFICVSAAACIADCSFIGSPTEVPARKPAHVFLESAGIAVVLLVLLALIAPNVGFTTRGLDEMISSQFPVAAANFLRQNPPPGPLYNDLDWGGFLIWYLPDYPVAIDGRNDLYGDELDSNFVRVQSGPDSYVSDPSLNHAGVVLLRASLPLVDRLLSDEHFSLVYRDRLAAVFVRRRN
jgi:hypothetical protein